MKLPSSPALLGPTTVAILLAAVLSFGPAQAQQTNAATTNGSAVIAAGNTFQTILPALGAPPAQRRSLTIQNNQTTTDNCWIFIGSGAATKGTSILLTPSQAYTRFYPYVPSDAIQATCLNTSDTLYVDTQ
jgi:hypothetical protein